MKLAKSHYLVILFLTGFLLFICSNGRWIIPVATWLAPVLLLRVSRDSSFSLGQLLLFFGFLLSSFIMLYGIIPVSIGGLAVILFTYYSILWFLPYLVDKLFYNKFTGFKATLFFPAVYVSLEYLNTLFFGSWAALAYTQFEILPLIQLSSIVGIWGISFIIMWFASFLNWLYEYQFNWRKSRQGVYIFCTILIFIFLYGGARMTFQTTNDDTTTVISFTPQESINKYQNELNRRGYGSSVQMADKEREVLSRLLRTIYSEIFFHQRKILLDGVSISIWPEGMIPVLQEDELLLLQEAKEISTEYSIYMLLAYIVLPSEDPGLLRENKSVMIDPNGDIVWDYVKTHPVPGSTDMPGDGKVPIIDTPFGRLSNTICYDMDFTSLIHSVGKKGIDIMLVPAWDWKAINPLHARMAVFRAIENGFSMVRQTGEGLSIAVDYFGNTLASLDYFTSSNQVMIAHVPNKGVWTVYRLIGDLFAWICLFGVMFGMVKSFLLKRHSSEELSD